MQSELDSMLMFCESINLKQVVNSEGQKTELSGAVPQQDCSEQPRIKVIQPGELIPKENTSNKLEIASAETKESNTGDALNESQEHAGGIIELLNLLILRKIL